MEGRSTWPLAICLLSCFSINLARSAAKPARKVCVAHLFQVACVPKGTKMDLKTWFAKRHATPARVTGALQAFLKSGSYTKSEGSAMKKCFGALKGTTTCRVMSSTDCKGRKKCRVTPPLKDYCSPKNPCLNGGRCFTTAKQFVCQCSNGYSGNKCQYGSLTKRQFDAALQTAGRLLSARAKALERRLQASITKVLSGQQVGSSLKSSIQTLTRQQRALGGSMRTAMEGFRTKLSTIQASVTKLILRPVCPKAQPATPKPIQQTLRYFSSKRSYGQARATCKRYGLVLAYPSDSASNNRIRALFARSSSLHHGWIGVHHMGRRDWIDESGAKQTYFKWYPREPNGGSREQCAEMYINHDGKWNDAHCARKFAFICSSPSTACPKQSRDLTPKFTVFRKPETFASARTTCRRHGRVLAYPTDAQSNKQIQHALQQKGIKYAWFGINRVDRSGWVDEMGSKQRYFNWDRKEPNGGSKEQCGEMRVGSGRWNDLSCNAKYPFVCMSQEPPEYLFFPKKVQFAAAQATCRRLGTTLYLPTNYAESARLSQWLKSKHGLNGHRGAYIGFNRRGTRGTWVNEYGVRVRYIRWDKHEPNNANPKPEECGELIPRRNGWNDIWCTYKLPFVCRG